QKSGTLTEDVLATTQTTTTKNDFDQSYVGIYSTATRGRLIADLQLRGEKTDFTLNNAGIGLHNADLGIKAWTLSVALTANIPLGENGWSVLPTGGFMYSKAKSDDLVFESGDRLKIADQTTKLGFVGVAVSKLKVSDAGDSAISYFATGTYYHDFS